VPARGTQQIQITYYQPVDYDSGFGTYVYPLEMKKGAITELEGEFSVMVDLKSDIPMKRVYSPSHADGLVTAEMKPGHYRASIENAKGNLDRDFVLVYELQRERMGINMITSRDKGDDGYFMLLVTPGPQFDEPKRQVNATFVLDVSGSMNVAGKLDVARRAVAEAIGLLKETDTFNIIVFNIAPRNFAEQPVAASGENRDRAIEFLKGLDGKGGTDIVPALERAFAMQVVDARNAVVLLSDGQATDIADHSAFMNALRRRKNESRIFSFGIGNDVNRPLLDRIAVETGGLADYLSGQDEINRKVRLMAAKLASPAAENLAVRFDGVDVFDVSPAKIPNLYRGQQLVLFGRYHKSGEAKLALSGQFLGQPSTVTAALDFPEKDLDNPEIQRMWAWRMVDEKLSQIREHGESAGPISEVVALGTKYSIVTPYTAFLVLENEAEYQRFNIERLNARRTENERAAQERQRQSDGSAQPARDVQWSSPHVPPIRDNGAGGGGGGGAVEWLFLAGLGALTAGRLWERRAKTRIDSN
jgi:Ca-activated chloride channel family protein